MSQQVVLLTPQAQPALRAAVLADGTAGTVAAGPTLTLHLDMIITGPSILPFGGDQQFAAASSLAGAFSIIIGSGSVQILSSSQVGKAEGRQLMCLRARTDASSVQTYAPAAAPAPTSVSVRKLLASRPGRRLNQVSSAPLPPSNSSAEHLSVSSQLMGTPLAGA